MRGMFRIVLEGVIWGFSMALGWLAALALFGVASA